MKIAKLQQFVEQLREVAQHNGHRYLIFLSGEPNWAEEQLTCFALGETETLLLAAHPLCGVKPKIAKQQLGREFSSVVIDANSAQSVDDWLAAAGTLLAGGLLVILCPDFGRWPQIFQRHSAAAKDYPESQFLARILTMVGDSAGVYHLSRQGLLDSQSLPQLPGKSQQWLSQLPTFDQQSAVDAIIRVVTGRAKRPLVIRSDRGRGKSSSLGIAVAELFQGGLCRRIAITAPRAEAVEAAFRRVQTLMPAGERHGDAYYFNDCELQFLPAFALKPTDNWDLVLVDEAATLPVSVLSELLQHPRIVFSTTVHGYEGSGRGFDIRFKDILHRERPQWRRIELREPVRWASDDPLEQFLNNAFLLDAEPKKTSSLNHVSVRVLHQTDLEQQGVLSQVFGLLVQAHYQTTPSDLQYLMDSRCQVIAAESDGCIVGVCQLLAEGGLDEATTNAVIAGERRPKGHLVAQRLAHISGNANYARGHSYRVNRIAVAAECRRQGVGRLMLGLAEECARHKGASYLSSSFAVSADVILFWRRQEFLPVWLGSRRDSASGAYSLLVVKSLGDGLDTDFNLMQQRLRSDLPLSFISVHRNLSTDSLATLLSCFGPGTLSLFDSNTVRRYCRRELVFEQAVASATRLSLCVDLCAVTYSALAVDLLLFALDWASVSLKYQLAGRAAVEQELRKVFEQMLTIVEVEQK